MRAERVRTYAAAAAVPAVIIILAHLAYAWEQHPSSGDRQSTAFAHGIGLAAILAAVLAHLADDWSAGSAAVRSVRILVEHLAALGLVALAAWAAGRLEEGRRE